MENQMNLYYDEEGDFLEITNGDVSDCYFDNVGDGVFKITDKKTKEVRGIAISSFKKKSRNLDTINVSLPFKFKISSI